MRRLPLPILASIAVLALVVGCGKTPDSNNAAAAEQVVPEAAPTPVAAPTGSDTTVVAARFKDSQAAINSGNYDQAATALIAIQQTALTEQQAQQLSKQMQQLQSALAGAVASGDPKAKAAADKLRQASSH